MTPASTRRRTRRCCGRSWRAARCRDVIQSCASAYSTAKSAGWATAVAVSRRAASGDSCRGRRACAGPRRAARRTAPRSGRTGGGTPCSAYRSRPMSGYCAPWPGNMKATPASAPRGLPRCAAGPGAASARAASAASRGDDEGAVREGAPAELQRVGDVGERRVRVRRPGAQPGCVRAAASAVALRAESTSSCAAAGRGRARRCGGASSSTTCALVPPTPNELTPARRGVARAASPGGRALTKNGLAAKSICGLGLSKCSAAGSTPCSSASAVLISPATPAAASRWPTLDFTEPSAQKPAAACARRTPC